MRLLLPVVPAAGLLLAFLFPWPEAPPGWTARDALLAGTLPVLAVLVWDLLAGLLRGRLGLDLIAALAIGGALLMGEWLAAAVVALMYAGGGCLEAWAGRRARGEMTALLARQPRTATRLGPAGAEQVPLAALAPGDRVLVRQGEVVPVDGTLLGGEAVLDMAALTGESLPVRPVAGDAIPSGAGNLGEAFELLATRDAADSTYAGIVRLVENAQAARPPMARLADRWALAFLFLTLALAGGAWWYSGDPLRALAVLVVATPCPLILAVPVALVAGLSRCARRGLLVKSGAALEALARIRVLLLDKTGTLTEGRAALTAIHAAPGEDADELLRLAASLDQASGHVVAAALVAEAKARGLVLPLPEMVHETPGAGIAGYVEQRDIAVGGAEYIAARIGETPRPPPLGVLRVDMAVDGHHAASFDFADRLRPEAPAMLKAARAAGIRRVVLVSGDQEAVAARIGAAAGVDAVLGNQTPADKAAVVATERRHGPVLMLGDGVNDAPALAAADVGVAMGVHGAAASAEAADAVLLVDRLDRLAEALLLARRTRGIALQSVAVGIGLSALGMLFAALGQLTPVQGAVLQEAIDIAVILNALRALQGGEAHGRGDAVPIATKAHA